MGFFSGITNTLFGGAESKAQNSSQSGFALLPPEIQQAYNGYAGQVNSQLANPAALTKAYTPTPFTAAQNTAIGNVNNGFAPTSATIGSDIAMQTNPFDQYVIDEINRQSTGDYSILKQAQDAAGQSGSNRGMLGANDIDLSRLNQIGGFKQSQYNTALQNALTTLPQARAGDAANQLSVGSQVQNLQNQTNQSQISGLQALGGLLGILPSNGGSTAQGTSSSLTQKGIFSS